MSWQRIAILVVLAFVLLMALTIIAWRVGVRERRSTQAVPIAEQAHVSASRTWRCVRVECAAMGMSETLGDALRSHPRLAHEARGGVPEVVTGQP